MLFTTPIIALLAASVAANPVTPIGKPSHRYVAVRSGPEVTVAVDALEFALQADCSIIDCIGVVGAVPCIVSNISKRDVKELLACVTDGASAVSVSPSFPLFWGGGLVVVIDWMGDLMC